MHQRELYFDGPDEPADPGKTVRLNAQLQRVLDLMLDGCWRTLGEISSATGAPEASASARLRDLKKVRFGAWTVDREHVGGGLYRYRVRR